MDTIAINANEALGENGQDKKESVLSDKAKAAMATGVAGVAVGAGAGAVIDAMNEALDNRALTDAESVQAIPQPEAETTEMTEDVIAEVNPDDVMLEQEDTISSEADMIAQAEPQQGDADDYKPFANNDYIDNESEDMLPEPQPEEELIAENPDGDVPVDPEADSTVDLICGLPETEPLMPCDATDFQDDSYAFGDTGIGDVDVQSDLMA